MEDTRLKSRNNFKIPNNISLDLAATLTAILRSTNVSIDLRRTLRLSSWFLAYIDNLNGFNEKIIFLCSLKFLVERGAMPHQIAFIAGIVDHSFNLTLLK